MEPHAKRKPAGVKPNLPAQPAKSRPAQNCGYALQVFCRIDADRVVGRLTNVDGYAVLQEAQLFQPLRSLQRRFRVIDKKVECGLSISVKTKVFEVTWSGGIAIEGNG